MRKFLVFRKEKLFNALDKKIEIGNRIIKNFMKFKLKKYANIFIIDISILWDLFFIYIIKQKNPSFMVNILFNLIGIYVHKDNKSSWGENKGFIIQFNFLFIFVIKLFFEKKGNKYKRLKYLPILNLNLKDN